MKVGNWLLAALIGLVAVSTATAAPPKIDVTKGIEFSDTNGNGKLDQVVLYFDNTLDTTQIDISGAGFTVEGYTITKAYIPDDNYKVVILTLQEKNYDTDATPEVTYNKYATSKPLKGTNDEEVDNIGPGDAVEVDKAAPVLVTDKPILTRDLDKDGKIDAYALLFSEIVYPADEKFTESFLIAGGYSWTGEAECKEGAGDPDTLYIYINETIINTAAIPGLSYKDSTNYRIRDNARSATGAEAPNEYSETVDGTFNYVIGTHLFDGVSPVIKFAATADTNHNGKIDRVTVVFSEDMKKVSEDTLKMGASVEGYTITGVKYDTDRLHYSLEEKAYDTDATPLFSYTPGYIVDANDYPLAAVSATAEDNAPPQIVELWTGDGFSKRYVSNVNVAKGTHWYEAEKAQNGKIDHYKLVFSEPIEDLVDSNWYQYSQNFTIVGHTIEAVWQENSTTLYFLFDEGDVYDTDNTPEVTYDKVGPGYKIKDQSQYLIMMESNPLDGTDYWTEKDGAKPWIYKADTMDRDHDGYIDAFKLYFSEYIKVNDPHQPGLTVEKTESGNTVTIDSVKNVTENTAEFWGHSDKAGTYDTEDTPELSYDEATGTIGDKADPQNMAASRTITPADKAAPVIVRATGQVKSTHLRVEFSEPVYTNTDKDTLVVGDFEYYNVYDPTDTTNATTVASVSEGDGGDEKVTLEVDNIFLVKDVENDSLRVKANEVFDAEGNAAYQVWVTIDDRIAPWITDIRTIDYDRDGWIDYLRFVFSEDVNDASLYGYVEADSMTEDVSSRWDVAGFTGERWNLYDCNSDLFVGDNLADSCMIDTDGDGELDTWVYISKLEGAVAFEDNEPDDNVLYMALDEASGAASAVTGIGNTDAAPSVAITDPTVSDFKPNVLNVANSVTTAEDKVGPVIMSAKSILVKAVEITFSEDIDAATLDSDPDNDFGLDMPDENSKDNIVKSWESSPGKVIVEVDPGAWWQPATEGRVKFDDLKVIQDTRENWNSTSSWVDVDDGVANHFSVVPDTLSPVVGEPFTVTVTALDSDGDVDVNFSGEVTLGTQLGSASFPSGERYSLTEGVAQFSVVAVDTLPFVIRVSYDYGHEVVAVGLSDTIQAVAAPEEPAPTLDAPDWVQAEALGGQGTFVKLTWDLSKDNPGLGGNDLAVEYAILAVAMQTQTVVSDTDTVVTTVEVPKYQTVVPALVLGGAGLPEVNTGSVVFYTYGDTTTLKYYVWAQNRGVPLASAATPVAKKAYAKLADGSVLVELQPYKAAKSVPAMRSAAVASEPVAAYDGVPPAPVAFVRAVDTPADEGGSITVSWAASPDDKVFMANGYPVPGVSEYRIYRKALGEEEFKLVGSVPAGTTSFADVADNNVDYIYKVCAVDPSNEVMSEVEEVAFAAVNVGVPVGDFTSDGRVDFDDFFRFIDAFGTTSEQVGFEPLFDLTADGKVDFDDFFAFVDHFGEVAGAKRVPVALGINTAAQLLTKVVEDGSDLVVEAAVERVADAKGFGLVLRYDPRAYEFVRAEASTELPMLVKDEAGEVVFAYAGELKAARLYFRPKDELGGTIEVVRAVVADPFNRLNPVEVLRQAVVAPKAFVLGQNRPNPFNPTTVIEYTLPEAASVKLEVYNMLGQVVRTLVDGEQQAGRYSVAWDGRDDLGREVATGIYFYRLSAGKFHAVRRMVLVR